MSMVSSKLVLPPYACLPLSMRSLLLGFGCSVISLKRFGMGADRILHVYKSLRYYL